VKRRPATLLLVLAIVVNACVAGAGGITLLRADVPRAAAEPAAARLASGAINAFGLDLLGALRGVDAGRGNLVVSPASIAIALGMARAGAQGKTAAQMDAVMRSLASEEHASWLNALDAALAARSGTFRDASGTALPVTLRIANAPFAQRDMAIAPAYLEALASRFGAGLRLVDYRTDPEAARTAINHWVAEQTEQRIRELLARDVITTETRLALVNAIYLKAPWLTPFPPEATRPGLFTRPDGTTVEVPMMALSEAFPYAEGNGWRAVELPYVGGSLALTVIVPERLAELEASLTGERLEAIIGALRPRPVELALPRFGIETRANLADLLAALGMPLAFDPDQADFSGITTADRLYISAVIHQANIDLDEKGTEAAAASAVIMGRTSAPAEAVVLRVDRPFLFALRDVPTGAFLFLGRVTDPAAAR